jgi:hypothetical protein
MTIVEEDVSYFVGQKIVKVVYRGIKYENNEYFFFSDPRFDSLDFGVEFTFSNGATRSITWGSTYSQYDLLILDESLFEADEHSTLDVTHQSRWSDLLDQKITSAEVFFSYDDRIYKSEVYYPQDILFGFENGLEVVISALEIRSDSFCSSMQDHITIFFDSETARLFDCLAE